MPKRSAEDPRVNLFIHEYVQDFNAARAYKAAGYSENGARQGASRLLTSVDIRGRVAQLLQERCEALLITKDRVLRETALLAFSNMKDYMTVVDGEARMDLSELTRDQAAAIQEIREDATGGSGDGERKKVVRTTLKLVGKTAALELLGKHLNIFSDKVEHSGPDGGSIPIDFTVKFVKPKRRTES